MPIDRSLIPWWEAIWLVSWKSKVSAKSIETFDSLGVLQSAPAGAQCQEAGYVHGLVSRMAIWWSWWIESVEYVKTCGNDSGAFFYVLQHTPSKKVRLPYIYYGNVKRTIAKNPVLLGLQGLLPLWQLTWHNSLLGHICTLVTLIEKSRAFGRGL
jgi:hypothetical protein